MIRTLYAALAAAGLAASASGQAAAAMTPLQSLQTLTGTWSCLVRDGVHKPMRSAETLTMQGPWLRFAFTAPGSTGTAYLSYDREHKHWVYMEIDSDGEYGVSTSTSASYANSVFHSVYPTSPNAGDVFIRVRGNNRMDDVFTYKNAAGKTITASVICTR